MRVDYFVVWTLVLASGTICSYAFAGEDATRNALNTLGKEVACPLPIRVSPQFSNPPVPSVVKTWKVVPRKWSAQGQAQFVRLTGVDVGQTYEGSSAPEFRTPGVKFYGSIRDDHCLTLVPDRGWFIYRCSQAIDDSGRKTAIVGLDEAQVLSKAFEIARMFDMSEEDFARHPITGKFDCRFTKLERTASKTGTRVIGRGVFLRRAVDGLPVFTGGLQGGLRAEFGIEGQLHKMELTARAIEPTGSVRLAPVPQQISALTSEKRFHLVLFNPDWSAYQAEPEARLELTWLEAGYFEDERENPQQALPLVLRWEAKLIGSGERKTLVFFSAPIISR
jgi:hypothetical protein